MHSIVESLVYYLCLFDWSNTNGLRVLRQKLFDARQKEVNIHQEYHNQYTVTLLDKWVIEQRVRIPIIHQDHNN